MTVEEYCREIEAYLCRKNDGHLIRLVGPSFERVCRWAADGIPFKVACQGIDRYFIRYYAKGVRRRPVQIDFCENDVLDAFDSWRRAVGVRVSESPAAEGEPRPATRRKSLPEHLDKICERVTNRRAAMVPPAPDFDRVLEQVAVEAAALRDQKGALRGDNRERVIARLAELDRLMVDAAREQSDAAVLQTLRSEASEELLPFRERMPPEAYVRALEAALDRLIREREQLPVVTFEH